MRILSAAFHAFEYGFGYKSRLALFCCGFIQDNFFAVARICPKIFAFSALIVLNHLISAGEYVLSRAVILLKAYYLCVFVLVFKREDVFYSCSSEAVYALVVISDDAYIFALCTQKCDELVLNHVCVLILINKHVFIQILIVVKDIRILFKQLYGEKYDVVKIDGVCSLKSLLIA